MDEHFETILRIHKEACEQVEDGQEHYQKQLSAMKLEEEKIYNDLEAAYQLEHAKILEQNRLALDNVADQEANLVKSNIEVYKSRFETIASESKQSLLEDVIYYHGT